MVEAGAAKSLDYRLGPLLTVVLGGITGRGGGAVRDVLLGQVPAVLRVDIYASAALVGATVTLAIHRAGLRVPLATAAGRAGVLRPADYQRVATLASASTRRAGLDPSSDPSCEPVSPARKAHSGRPAEIEP